MAFSGYSFKIDCLVNVPSERLPCPTFYVSFGFPRSRLDVRFFFSEPTSNVAPKKVAAEFGFRVVKSSVGEVTWLICQVTGFPVPLFM